MNDFGSLATCVHNWRRPRRKIMVGARFPCTVRCVLCNEINKMQNQQQQQKQRQYTPKKRREREREENCLPRIDGTHKPIQQKYFDKLNIIQKSIANTRCVSIWFDRSSLGARIKLIIYLKWTLSQIDRNTRNTPLSLTFQLINFPDCL